MIDQQHEFMGLAAITVASLLPISVPTHSAFPPATINKPFCAPKFYSFAH